MIHKIQKPTRKAIYVCISFLLFSLTPLWAQFNSLRCTYYHRGECLPEDFVKHAKKYNYNYIIAEFHFRDVDHPSDSICSDIRNALKIVARNGMRLIPKIQLNSGWSAHWRHVRDHENKNIQMNLIRAKSRSQKNLSWWGCPSFAPDSSGLDKSFENVIKKIVSMYQVSNVSFPLEYIHLGGDEPMFYTYMHIGGVVPGEHGDNKAGKWYIEENNRHISEKDRTWIKDFLGTEIYTDKNISYACQALFIRSYLTKVRILKKHLPDAKILIYADMLDSSMNGPNKYITSFQSARSKTPYCLSQFIPEKSDGIGSLPGLTKQEKKLFRNNVICLPWNYNGLREYAGVAPVREDYDTFKSFSYFAKNGLKFIYTFELIPASGSLPPSQQRLKQMKEFVETASLFKKNCLGYNATHWSADWDNPDHKACFLTMEELSKANSK